MSEPQPQPPHKPLGDLVADVGRALKALGRAMPITRGAAFYTTLVLLLTLFVWRLDTHTTAHLNRTQAGICTVIHGADHNAAAAGARLEAAVTRSRQEARADARQVTVWKFALRQATNPEGHKLARRLVRSWQTLERLANADASELRSEIPATRVTITFPGC